MVELDQVCLEVYSRGCGLISSMNSSASFDCEEAKKVLFRLTQRRELCPEQVGKVLSHEYPAVLAIRVAVPSDHLVLDGVND